MPHGHIDLSWVDKVLHIQVFGPFNLSGIKQAFADIREAVNQKTPENWYRLEVLDQHTLGSPEVMKVIGASYLWCFNHGCEFIAVVCSNRIQKGILAEFIKATGSNMQAFDSQDEAESHIQKLRTQS